MVKICSKCGEEKEIKKNSVCDVCLKEKAKFYRNKYKSKEPKEKICTKCRKIERIKKGSVCKECVDKRNKIYFSKPESKEKKKSYYEINKEKNYENQKEYWKNNIEKKKISQKKYYEKNKEKLIEKERNYKSEHKEQLKERSKEYYIDNRYKIYEKIKKDRKLRPYIHIWRNFLRGVLTRFGRKKEGHTIDLLGYSSTDLKYHIEKQFEEGMSWDNYGEWEIDHIKEICTFDKETPMNIVNSLDNLQPLWKKDNWNKWLELKKKLDEYGLQSSSE